MKTRSKKPNLKNRVQRTIIDIIPHKLQRYPTCGDYLIDNKGDSRFFISDMGNPDLEFLVSLHEQIESHLTRRRGLSDAAITEFDVMFEKERTKGMHSETAEPGDDQRSPYRQEHLFATGIEKIVAAHMGIDWNEYELAINEL